MHTLFILPLAVPGLVITFGYLVVSQTRRLFAYLNPIASAMALLITAHAIRRLPFMIRSVLAGLQQTNIIYEEAAQRFD
jgi:iron(III) transport system permease protein